MFLWFGMIVILGFHGVQFISSSSKPLKNVSFLYLSIMINNFFLFTETCWVIYFSYLWFKSVSHGWECAKVISRQSWSEWLRPCPFSLEGATGDLCQHSRRGKGQNQTRTRNNNNWLYVASQLNNQVIQLCDQVVCWHVALVLYKVFNA